MDGGNLEPFKVFQPLSVRRVVQVSSISSIILYNGYDGMKFQNIQATALP